MRLNDSERQTLARMVREIAAEDPDFVVRMQWPDPVHRRRLRGWLRDHRPGPHLLVAAIVALATVALALLVLGSLYVWPAALAGGGVLLSVDLTWAAMVRLGRASTGDR